MELNQILNYWKPALETLIIWFAIYHMMLFFVNSRAVNALRGIIVILIAVILFRKLNLTVLDWLTTKLLGLLLLAALIIFGPEIRQGLARLGERYRSGRSFKDKDLEESLREIINASEQLARDKIGALIAIENKDSLSSYAGSGVILDAHSSSDLIQAVFTPPNPLHDGGMIISRNKILAAGCLFPLTEKPDLNRIFGTRHRAALGLSEETDAVIVIVSEERQNISLIYGGRLFKDLDKEELIHKIKEALDRKR
jgi:diadenylate cyclase